MSEVVPDYLSPAKKEEKKNCAISEIVICAVPLSIGAFGLLLWVPVLPWVCIALDMAYHNLANEAGHPGNAPLSDRLFTGAVTLLVILYPVVFLCSLVATVLRLNKTVLKYTSPILFASIPLLYISFLVFLVVMISR